jgi:hypothetical protein
VVVMADATAVVTVAARARVATVVMEANMAMAVMFMVAMRTVHPRELFGSATSQVTTLAPITTMDTTAPRLINIVPLCPLLGLQVITMQAQPSPVK